MKDGGSPVRVLFVVPSFSVGGAERKLVNILRGLDRRTFRPSVAVFEKRGIFLKQIPEDVVLFDLRKRSRWDFIKLVFRLAYGVIPAVRPDAVVCILHYANLVALLAKIISPRSFPIIITKVNYLSMELRHERMRRTKAALVRWLYPRADAILTISKRIITDLHFSFGIPMEKMKAVYNGIDHAQIERLKAEPVSDVPWFEEGLPVIVACGRLTRQKNYPLLLEAFRRLSARAEARLLILGEGEEKFRLEELIHRCRLEQKVKLVGFQENPFRYMARGTIFVLSSDWEGFATVIIEAMACGLAVISTDCPSGPDEIITHGADGLLVPVGDAEALAGAMETVLKDEALRRRLAEGGRIRARHFTLESVVREYESAILEVCRGKVKADAPR